MTDETVANNAEENEIPSEEEEPTPQGEGSPSTSYRVMPESQTPEGDEGGEPTALETAIKERDALKDRLLRTAADYENFRKRMRRELEDTLHRAREDTVREVLPIIDNLERAALAAEAAEDVTAVAEGVKMVLRGFGDVASRLGLTRVKSVGEHFDPAKHDAMQQQETDEYPPGTIIEEAVPGYMLGDRLLRAAMVVVARPLSGNPGTPPEDSPDEDDVIFLEDEGNEDSDFEE